MLEALRVIELRAQNVKRIKTFVLRVDPTGGLVIIGGNNGEGKTSAIDALFWALGGTMAVQDVPIREGETSASTCVTLAGPDGEPQLIVTRSYTPKGSYLKVTSPEGVEPQKPQALLNQLFSSNSFDPLAFTRMSDREQRDALLGVVDLGINLYAWQTQNQELRHQRQLAKQERLRTVAALEALPCAPEGTPDVAPDAKAVSDRIAEAMATNERKQALDAESAHAAVAVMDTVSACKADVATAENAIRATVVAMREAEESHRSALAAERDVVARGAAKVSAAHVAAKRAADTATAVEPVAVADLQAELTVISEVADAVRVKKAWLAGEAEANAADAMLCETEIKVDQSLATRAEALAAAEMPVPGIGLGEDGSHVTLNGLPFNQASSAEQLAASVRLAMALNPRLRIMRIDDGSLLDDESMLALANLAVENDYQIIVERVGKGDPGAVIFENGVIEEE